MLTLIGVSKRYGNLVVLRPTTLIAEPRRTTILIGPSGSGKSTILRLMAGLIQPDAGSILFEGIPLTPATILPLRQRMGYVIQEGGLFPHLTARATVTLMARHLKWPSPAIHTRLRELLTLVRLPRDVLDRYPTELSGGQRQRISLMRALMLNPDVLLLDEPLGALDPMVRHDLQTELNRIFRTLRKTVVMVTHDMAEAAFFGDEIILLSDGRIVQRGSLEDLLWHPKDSFVERFISAQRSPLEPLARKP